VPEKRRRRATRLEQTLDPQPAPRALQVSAGKHQRLLGVRIELGEIAQPHAAAAVQRVEQIRTLLEGGRWRGGDR